MNRRVLIVNAQSIYYNNATGITLQSIFGKIDPQLLMEVYWTQDQEHHRIPGVKLNHRILSASSFLEKRRNSEFNTSLKKSESANIGSTQISVKTYIRQYLALIPDTEKIKISSECINKIEKFKPEVIYTLGGSLNALRIAYKISNMLNIPIVVHHMDNWMHSIQWENNPLLNGYKKKLREYCRKCYTRSTTSLTISEEMAKVFTQEYGIQHTALMNSIDVKTFDCDSVLHDPFRFTYAGGLHLERYKALIEIAEAVEDYNKKSTNKVELAIFTGKDNTKLYGGYFQNYPSVHLSEAVPHEKIKDVYQNSDALIHVESKTLEDNEFFKYSISTKIPEYLSTGKPMLFYGPESIYLYRFLKNNDIAFTVCKRDQIEEQIRQILENKTLVESKIVHAKSYAHEHFDISGAVKQMEMILDTVELP